MIRSQRGVRERSCLDWIEVVGKADEKIRRRHQKVVSHAAVEAESAAPAGSRGRQWVLAVDLYSVAAAGTVATAPRPRDSDRLADLPAVDAVAKGVNPPSVLVSESERRLPEHGPSIEVPHEMEIRVARTCSAHLHEHLPWTRFRDRDFGQDRIGSPLIQAKCTHS